jgi:hypothetical protein
MPTTGKPWCRMSITPEVQKFKSPAAAAAAASDLLQQQQSLLSKISPNPFPHQSNTFTQPFSGPNLQKTHHPCCCYCSALSISFTVTVTPRFCTSRITSFGSGTSKPGLFHLSSGSSLGRALLLAVAVGFRRDVFLVRACARFGSREPSLCSREEAFLFRGFLV